MIYVYHMLICPSPGRWLNTDTVCSLVFFSLCVGFRSHHCSKTVTQGLNCATPAVDGVGARDRDREKAGEIARYHLTVLGNGNGVLWKIRL